MSGLAQDLRLALRLLVRQPWASAVIVLTLALGIGFGAAIFSFLDLVFFHPVPAVRDPQGVVSVFDKDPGSGELLPLSFPNYKDLRDRNRSFSQLAAFQVTQVGTAANGRGEQVWAEMVTANYFGALGVKPILGRTFLPEEDRQPGAHPVAVVSFDYWRQRLGGRRDVLGKALHVNGAPFTVVGVAPPGFHGSYVVLSSAVWVPMMMYRQVFAFSDFFDDRGSRVVQVFGRLRPGVEVGAARAEMKAISAHLAREYPNDDRNMQLDPVPYVESTLPMDRRSVFVRTGGLLTGTVALLLAIACINVGNLQLTRTLARQKEVAVRLSMGASRGRLARQLLVESVLLAALAGAAGLLVALWCQRLLWQLRPPYVVEGAIALGLNGTLLTCLLALDLVAVVLFGAVSLLQTLRLDFFSTLRESGGGSGAVGSRLLLRKLIVGVQVALGLVCLACAGIFLASLKNAERIDPGFDAGRLLSVGVDLRIQGYDEARGRSFQRALIERARGLPGVQSAALAENRPLSGWSWWRRVPVESSGVRSRSAQPAILAGSHLVGPGYFKTVGIPIVQGREFGEADRDGSHPVIVVNETLARRAWPGRSPLGIAVRLDEETTPAEVVGVARDIKYRSLGEEPQPFLYLPLLQRPSLRAALLVRAAHPESLVGPVEGEIRRLDRELPILEAAPISQILARSLWAPQAGARVLSLFGAAALLLAALGVYGVTSYAIQQRRGEIALRMALGATPAGVVRLVFTQGMAVVALGILAGLVLSYLTDRWIRSLLYVGGSGELLALAFAALVLAAIGSLANLLPARRAIRGEPSSLIRLE